MKKQLTLKERLTNSFSLNENGCHEWIKSVSKKGYGVIGIGSRRDKSRKIIYAHRASFEIINGEIPQELCVLHKCDNRKCINPEHLFLGTPKDNTHDMINKNRDANKKGIVPSNFLSQIIKVKNGHFSKLNANQVIEIKKLLSNGINYKVIARQYKVSDSCISDIKRKATWVNI